MLLAPPQVAPDLGQAIQKDLEAHVITGVAAAGARIASQVEVQKHMEVASVTSLEARSDAITVASSMGAHAVLRYQAKKDGENVHLRLAIYIVASGKAVMLEKTVSPAELRETVAKMVAELMPPEGGGAETPGEVAVPESQPTEDDGKPKTPMLIWDAAVHSKSGVVGHVQIGGSIPIGGGTSDEVIEGGFRFGIHAGWQFQIGQMHGITPEIAFFYASWGFDSTAVVNGISVTGGAGMLNLLAGARYSLFIGAIEAFVAAHVGLGNVFEEIKAPGYLPLEDDKTGFAFNAEFGGHFMFMKYIGAGLVFDFSKAFVDKMDTGSEYDGLSFSIALSAKGKFSF